MNKLVLIAVLFLSIGFSFAQKDNRDPDPRKDFANVFWKRQYSLYDLVSDKPIQPKIKNGEKTYTIYYSSNEDPKPYKGTFTEAPLERHLDYKFNNKKTCKKFCKTIES